MTTPTTTKKPFNPSDLPVSVHYDYKMGKEKLRNAKARLQLAANSSYMRKLAALRAKALRQAGLNPDDYDLS